MSRPHNIKKKKSKTIGPPSGILKKEKTGQGKISWLDLILKPHTVFTIFAFVFGTCFMLSTPPFQVPDEVAHFDRAFKLTELGTFQKIENKVSGDYVPSSIDSAFNLFRYLSWRPDQKVKTKQITNALKIPLNTEERTFAKIDAWNYFYVSYIPQFPAILLGKVFNLNILYIFYLGRFFALLFYILCVRYAIKIIPFAKHLLLTVALMPMCLAQAGSFNADCVTFSLVFLFVAMLLKISFNREGIAFNKELFLLIGILLFLGILKLIYLPIAFLIFLIPGLLFVKKNPAWVVVLSAFMLSAVFALGWLKLTGVADVSGINTAEKKELLFQNPWMVTDIVSNTLASFKVMYYKSTIGLLGYIDTWLPKSVYSAFAFLLLFLALFESNKNFRLLPYQRITLFLVSSSVFVLTILAMYFVTSVGAGLVAKGVQGRYFIPVVFPFFLAFYGLIPFKINLSGSKVFVCILYLILFIALVQTEATLIERYYG